MGRALELANKDDDRVEPGEKRLMDSVIVDQSKSSRGTVELPGRYEAVKEVDRSGE